MTECRENDTMDDKILIYLEYLHESGLKFSVFSCYGQMAVKNFIFTYFDIFVTVVLFLTQDTYSETVKKTIEIAMKMQVHKRGCRR